MIRTGLSEQALNTVLGVAILAQGIAAYVMGYGRRRITTGVCAATVLLMAGLEALVLIQAKGSGYRLISDNKDAPYEYFHGVIAIFIVVAVGIAWAIGWALREAPQQSE